MAPSEAVRTPSVGHPKGRSLPGPRFRLDQDREAPCASATAANGKHTRPFSHTARPRLADMKQGRGKIKTDTHINVLVMRSNFELQVDPAPGLT